MNVVDIILIFIVVVVLMMVYIYTKSQYHNYLVTRIDHLSDFDESAKKLKISCFEVMITSVVTTQRSFG